MYLALFQDVIAEGGQYDSVRYAYCNKETRRMSMGSGRAFNTMKAEERGKFSALETKELKYEGSRWELPEPQQLDHPIGKIRVPSICITPPDSMNSQPLNLTRCEDPQNDGNDCISNNLHEEVDQPNSSGYDIGRMDLKASEPALSTATMDGFEELSSSLPLHDAERLTKDYEDWLRLAQGAACGDNVAGQASDRAGPSRATSESCSELILWRPETTTATFTSGQASARKASVGRRFSLHQPMVYPFRTKRNSV